MELPSLDPTSLDGVVRYQVWWARAPVVVFLAWLASLIMPRLGVPASFALVPLVLSIALLAVPPPAPEGGYRAWRLVAVGLMLCPFAQLYMAGASDDDRFATTVFMMPLVTIIVGVIGAVVDNAMAPRLERGRGRTRPVTRAATVLAVALSVGALAQFAGRTEPAFARPEVPPTVRSIGSFQGLGPGCPPACDRPARGAPSPAESDAERVDPVAPGVTIERRRAGFVGTRTRIMVRTRAGAAVVALDRTIVAHQPVEVSSESTGRFLFVDIGSNPRAVVRLRDGAALDALDYELTLREDRRATLHAPASLVLLALAGVALASWFLRRAERAMMTPAKYARLREGRVDAQGVIHFDDGSSPAALPPGHEAPEGCAVVVLAVEAAHAHAYRSDPALPLATLWSPGTRDEHRAMYRAQATAWEHGALAAAIVTQTPLLGALLFGAVK